MYSPIDGAGCNFTKTMTKKKKTHHFHENKKHNERAMCDDNNIAALVFACQNMDISSGRGREDAESVGDSDDVIVHTSPHKFPWSVKRRRRSWFRAARRGSIGTKGTYVRGGGACRKSVDESEHRRLSTNSLNRTIRSSRGTSGSSVIEYTRTQLLEWKTLIKTHVARQPPDDYK